MSSLTKYARHGIACKINIDNAITDRGGTVTGSVFRDRVQFIESIPGVGIPLSSVITDNTLAGDGTENIPLGLMPRERLELQIGYFDKNFGALTEVDAQNVFPHQENIAFKVGDYVLDNGGTLAVIVSITHNEINDTLTCKTLLPTSLNFRSIKGDISANEGFRNYVGDLSLFDDELTRKIKEHANTVLGAQYILNEILYGI